MPHTKKLSVGIRLFCLAGSNENFAFGLDVYRNLENNPPAPLDSGNKCRNAD
jgi:hypothetical protein